MTYGEIRDASLQLIGQYTIAGNPYEDTYNNQADYIAKVPFLINDCLIYIASSVRRMPAEVVIYPEDGIEYGNWLRFKLPNDLLEFRSGGLLVPAANRTRGESSIWTHYKLAGPLQPEPGEKPTVDNVYGEDNYTLLLPREIDHPLVLQYYRKPALLPLGGEPGYDTPIDAPITVQMAIPYYVAAKLVMEDDAFRYASLQNEFENKVSRLTPPAYTEIQTVRDVYGNDGFFDPLPGPIDYYGG